MHRQNKSEKRLRDDEDSDIGERAHKRQRSDITNNDFSNEKILNAFPASPSNSFPLDEFSNEQLTPAMISIPAELFNGMMDSNNRLAQAVEKNTATIKQLQEEATKLRSEKQMMEAAKPSLLFKVSPDTVKVQKLSEENTALRAALAKKEEEIQGLLQVIEVLQEPKPKKEFLPLETAWTPTNFQNRK